MSGPWEQYAQAGEAGPWVQYAEPASPPVVKSRASLPKREWSDVPLEALTNIPSSAGNFIGGIYQAVRHPFETGGNLIDAVGGGIYNALPKQATAVLDKLDRHPAKTKQAVQVADATGQFFKDRYGSTEGLKNTLATDPVGVASDVATVLSGGALAAAKAPAVAGALRRASNAINPVSLAGVAARKALPVLGNSVAQITGGLGTHTGAESIKQAYRAGKNGGATERALTDNMRGNVPMTDVLDAAKANIADMGRAKSAAYRQGMAQVSSDKTILDFTGIDQAVLDAANVGSFKGQAKNVRAAAVQQSIADEVAAWKALDPVEYHTPEGLDALKQRIGGIVEALPFEEKTARLAGDKIYHAVKSEIVRQAPVYADTMKGYAEATEQIREIERALSLGKKPAIDTAVRKLQSLTRNNVNTNYGNRLDLARQLEQQGGRDLMPALSGQALSSWTPRGLGSLTAGGTGLAAMNGVTGALPMLALQSPRLVGEAALATGKAARGIRRATELPRRVLTPERINLLYQAGRLPQE